MKPYMVIFKPDAPQSSIDEQISAVESKGGKISQKFDSSIMRGFAATLPDEHANELRAATEGDGHEHM
jgi:hypothetical protein